MKKENDLDQRFWEWSEAGDSYSKNWDSGLGTRDSFLNTRYEVRGASPKKMIALLTAIIFAWSMICPLGFAETINLQGGSVDVNVQDNVTNWNVTGNPIWNVPEFNVNQGSIYNVAGMGSGSSLALLVNGGNATNIFGTMNLSNLDFILQNIAGINIGNTGLINLNNASLIASTLPLNLTSTQFLAHQYQLEGNSGFLLNEGRIVGTNSALVALVGNAVENRGTIEVPMGTVALAAGNTVAIGISGDGLVSIGVDEATANSMGLSDQIKNSGRITAQAGRVILDAKAIDGLFDKAINIAAGSNATSVIQSDDGVIEFVAQGDVLNNGTLQAERGSIDIRATGDVESYGTLKAATITERGASFRLGGLISAGHVSMDNLDNLANITPGLAIDVDVFSDDDDILVEGNFSILRDVTIQTDADGLGTDGTLTWSSDYTMTGNSHNLTLKVSQDSTVGAMTGVNLLTLDVNTGKTVTYTGSTSDDIYANTIKTNLGTTFSKDVVDGAGNHLIYSVSDAPGGLQYIRHDATTLSDSYKVVNNIDASETSSWNWSEYYEVYAGFNPVGYSTGENYDPPTDPFIGNFDGQGHVIDGLYVNRRDGGEYNRYIGLFGIVQGASISNVGLTNVSLDGFSAGAMAYGGAIAGYTDESTVIENVFSTGIVGPQDTGSIDISGGLVGHNEGVINNSYSSAVIGNSYAGGGLVGENLGTITNSYSSGAVNAAAFGGGFVGMNDGGTYSNNFWNTETSGQQWATSDGITVAGVTGKTTVQMKQQGTFTGWDFNGLWQINAAEAPHLIWQDMTGGGTAANPWLITNVNELQFMGYDLDGSFQLANDIDASGTATWNAGMGFAPVGHCSDWNCESEGSSPFAGNFDGQGKTIDALFISREAQDNVGLFGKIYRDTDPAGSISNVGLTHADITGGSYVGALAGANGGAEGGMTISNSYATGTVDGVSYVGGLVGTSTALISNSYADVTVTGSNEYAGGLVGLDQGGINNSYALGDVFGGVGGFTGGLIGSGSWVTNSYSTGTVTGGEGSSYVGGFIGYYRGGLATNNFWNTETSGQEFGTGEGDVDGITGATTEEMMDQATFTGWDFTVDGQGAGSGTWIMAGLPHLQMEWSETISNLAQLQMMKLDLSANYNLVEDINASATENWNAGAGFQPIYDGANLGYSGTFEGNDHEISGLYFYCVADTQGLFGILDDGAVVRNVGLTDLRIVGFPVDSGGLAAVQNAGSLIENSYTTGTIQGGSWVGGLVGSNYGGAINSSWSSVSVTGPDWEVGSLGGLVGWNGGEITDSYATGSVTGGVGSTNIGGLVGHNYSGTITDAYATGAVSGGSGSYYIGGLVGRNDEISAITNSYATGVVTGVDNSDSLGGLVGFNSNLSTITNSYATGAVRGGDGSYSIGGLVGANDTGLVINSYATGTVLGGNGSTEVGGLIGYFPSGTLINNWWYNNQEYGVGNSVDKVMTGEWQKAGAISDFYGEGSGTGGRVYYQNDLRTVPAWDFDTVWTPAFDNDDQPLYFPSLAFDPRVFTEITTEAGLQAISTGNLAGNYYLGENITLEDDFTGYMIGDETTPFSGIFLGHGHTISDLFIEAAGYNVGFFGKTSGATLTDIGLLNVDVTGDWYVGGLVGSNNLSSISNSYTTGIVTGCVEGGCAGFGGLAGENISGSITNSYSTAVVLGYQSDLIGGLVGDNWNSSTIANSYATGAVTGSGYIGGLTGSNGSSTIINSYATGTVTGDVSGGLVGFNRSSNITSSYAAGSVSGLSAGGLVGIDDGGNTYTNNFWNTETSGEEFATGDGVPIEGITGATTEEMMDQATFTGWDFTVDGTGAGSGAWIMAGLPHLQMEWSETISNLAQLQMMALDLNANYTLADDINASATVNWNAGAGFVPVGYDGTPFTGSLNGDGFTISDLSIENIDNGVGLFGWAEGAVLSNIGLLNVNIVGNSQLGALVGENGYSTIISNSYATGIVNGGGQAVGGLVGYNHDSSDITGSYFSGTVTGDGQVGGLVGYNYSSDITNSYATGSVNGSTAVGGLVGQNIEGSHVTTSYATNAVTSDNDAGGLVGINDSTSTVANSYATGAVKSSGLDGTGGLVGINSGAISNSYASGSVTASDSVGGLVGYNASGSGISNSFSTGVVIATMTGAGAFGGLIGWSEGTLTNNWWYNGVNTLGVGTGNVEGVTKASAVSDFYGEGSGTGAAVYTGWDFDTVWTPTLDNDEQPLYFPSLAFDPRVFTEITTEAGLQSISSGDLAGNYYLGENITLEDDFTDYMIGDETTPFSGIFLGHGHTISDLLIDSSADNVGFFGKTSGATLTDMQLLNVDVTGGNTYTGGLVGYNGSSSVTNSYATGNVSGIYGVGGLAGWNVASHITNSYFSGTVTGFGAEDTGGLVGFNYDSSTISNSYATGTVSGSLFVGGLAGENILGSQISNSYSTSAVTGNDGTGGLVGWNYSSAVTNSYSTGAVNGNGGMTGGLIGMDNGETAGVFTNNFWDTETSGQEFGVGGSNVDGITGKTTTQMKQEATFTGWDFTSTWRMYEGFAYPLLKSFLTPITVTANNFTKIYDGSFTVLGSGVTYSIPSAVLEGTPGYSSPYKNVGTYVDGITVSGLWSTQQGYDITYAAGDLTISQKALAVTGVTVANKAYDGNTNATLNTTSAALDGVVVGEEELVLLDTTLAVGTFGGLSIGTWPVTVSGMTIEGAGIGNYLLNQPAGLSATIGNPIPPKAINATLNELQTIPVPPEQTKPAPVIQIGTETDNLTGNGATTVPASLVEEFRASLIEPAADLSAAEQPATLPAAEPVTEVGTEPAAVTPAEPTKDTPNVSKGEVDDRAGGRQVLSLFRNSFPDFFDPRLAMNLQTDVRVLGGAVYVLDGMNDLAYLTSGESVRKLYAKKKTTKTPPTSEVGKVQPPRSDGSIASRKPASPIVIRQTKEGMRYGTLRKPGKDVFMRSQGGEWMPAKDGMVILPGDEVKTAYKNSVEVLMDGGKVGRVEISGGSLFRISKAESDKTTGDKTTLLDLALGKILVKVEALKGNSKFEVRTPTALTGVRGTIFEVSVKEKA